MESPIETEYNSEIISIKDVTGSLPKNCLFAISYAKAELTELKDGTILRQYFSNYHYYMEMYEFNLYKSLESVYYLANPTMFLFAMLTGGVKFATATGEKITEVTKSTCYATTNRPGKYLCFYSKGRHCLAYIVYRENWIKKNPDHYPLLVDFLKILETNVLMYAHLPRCHIAGSIKEAFYNLYKDVPSEGEIFEDKLAIMCKHLLIRYYQALILKFELPAYQLKNFIDQNFALAEQTNKNFMVVAKTITEKTMIRSFKDEFGITPHAYLIQVRMLRAKQLITDKVHVNKVYTQVGYDDLRSFSMQFKKFFGFPPSEYQ